MSGEVPAERSLFRMEPAYASALDTYVIQNERELLTDLPRHSPRMFARQRRGPGFWPMAERPRVVIGSRCKILNREFDLMRAFWIVSERCRDVMSSIDGAAFAFLACDCYDRKGELLDTRWLCEVTRSLDVLSRFNAERPTIEGTSPAQGLFLDTMKNLIVRDREIPTDAHIFVPEIYSSHIIVSEHFRHMMKRAGIKNIRFNRLMKVP